MSVLRAHILDHLRGAPDLVLADLLDCAAYLSLYEHKLNPLALEQAVRHALRAKRALTSMYIDPYRELLEAADNERQDPENHDTGGTAQEHPPGAGPD